MVLDNSVGMVVVVREVDAIGVVIVGVVVLDVMVPLVVPDEVRENETGLVSHWLWL